MPAIECYGSDGDAPAVMTAMAVGAAILGAVVTDDALAERIESAVGAELRRRLRGDEVE